MLELRRTRAGIFDESKIYNLYDFEKAVDEFEKGNGEMLGDMLVSAEDVIKKVLPIIDVKEKYVNQLLTGKPIHKEDIKVEHDIFAVFCKDRFIGIYRKVDEGEIISRPEFVFN